MENAFQNILSKQEAVNIQTQSFQKQLRALQDKLGITVDNIEERKNILSEMRRLRGIPDSSSNNSKKESRTEKEDENTNQKFPIAEYLGNEDIYNFNYTPTQSVEYPAQEIIINNGTELQQKIQNKEILPNSTLVLAPGEYSGNFTIWAPNVKIIAQNPNNPPKFTGGPDKPYSLVFQEGGCTLSNIYFEGGEIAVRLNKENNTISHCNFSQQQRLGIDCKASNSLIEDCIISQFYKDGIFIQGDNVTVETCNIYDYLGTDDAHNDAIQIAAKNFMNKDTLYSGQEKIKNLRLIGNTIDMGDGKKNQDNEPEKTHGKNLQGIFAGQVMLEDAVIINNEIAVDSEHGISGSFLGKSLIYKNTIRKAGDGNTIPKIRLLPSRASNSVTNDISADYNVFVGKNEWENCDSEGGTYYYTHDHGVQQITNIQ